MASVLKVDTIKSLTGNEAMTITESGVPLLKVPAFHVKLGANQTGVTTTTDTKVRFDEVVFDTNNYWDAANYRYTPQIAGYYQFNASLWGISTSEARVWVGFWKNGVDTGVRQDSQLAANTITLLIQSTSHLIYLNGSTDYVETYGYIIGTTNSFGAGYTHFSGFLVRGA
jgi:hypothetical protein